MDVTATRTCECRWLISGESSLKQPPPSKYLEVDSIIGELIGRVNPYCARIASLSFDLTRGPEQSRVSGDRSIKTMDWAALP